jgi:sentrin-specific protease 1
LYTEDENKPHVKKWNPLLIKQYLNEQELINENRYKKITNKTENKKRKSVSSVDVSQVIVDLKRDLSIENNLVSNMKKKNVDGKKMKSVDNVGEKTVYGSAGSKTKPVKSTKKSAVKQTVVKNNINISTHGNNNTFIINGFGEQQKNNTQKSKPLISNTININNNGDSNRFVLNAQGEFDIPGFGSTADIITPPVFNPKTTLQNTTGQQCFMNVIIQLFLNCPCLKSKLFVSKVNAEEFILNLNELERQYRMLDKLKTVRVILCMKEFFKVYLKCFQTPTTLPCTVTADDFVNACIVVAKDCTPHHAIADQNLHHDAYEFYLFMNDKIFCHEYDEGLTLFPDIVVELQNSFTYGTNDCVFTINNGCCNHGPKIRFFEERNSCMSSEILCSLPVCENVIGLNECLRTSFEMEHRDDIFCSECEKNKRKPPLTYIKMKKFRFLPDLLILNFPRRLLDIVNGTRLSLPIIWNIDNSFLSQAFTEHNFEYVLLAVVLYHVGGTINSGHYTVCIFDLVTRKWKEYNDGRYNEYVQDPLDFYTSSKVTVALYQKRFVADTSTSDLRSAVVSNVTNSSVSRLGIVSSKIVRRKESCKFLLTIHVDAATTTLMEQTRNLPILDKDRFAIKQVFKRCRNQRNVNDIITAENLTNSSSLGHFLGLEGSNYQHGNVIDSYVEMLRDRMTRMSIERIYIGVTTFHSTLMNESREGSRYDYASVKRNFRRFDIFEDFDVMLFPVHLLHMGHWIIVRVDMVNKTIIRIDSMYYENNDGTYTNNILKFLQDEFFEQKGIRMNVDDWLIINKINCPQQQNGYDCGVFVMMFLDVMIDQIPLNVITQAKMADYRIKIGQDLMRGQLRY